MRIVLGVAGGIAAYKAVLVLRLLTQAGHDVQVVPTRAALRFVGAPTWQALSGHPVTAEVFDGIEDVPHVRLGRTADLVVVVPATADLLARLAAGLADDLLTATLLTARCPVLLAPAMHTQMWTHPATVANVATLRARGLHVLTPDDGRLTGPDSGAGRLPEPAAIVATALDLVIAPPGGPSRDLAGRRVLISAGGTREPVDPVRFLGNRSSGRQGVALATTALDRGADVVLVGANLAVPVPDGVRVRLVDTTAQLRDAMLDEADGADVVVMAAAVADFRPAAPAEAKVKKRPGVPAPVIELVENPDVLAELAHQRRRPGQVVVGFAAETGDVDGDVLSHGRAKALRKGADLLVVNDVAAGRAFGTTDNTVTLLDDAGQVVATASGPKERVADAVWDAVVARLTPRTAV